MRRTLTIFGLLLILSTGSALAQTFGTVLTAAGEDPPSTSPGFGNFTATLDSTRTNLTVNLTVANLGAPISGAHIHEKNAGSNTGGVKVNFVHTNFVNGALSGTFPVPASDPTLFARMVANPSNFYVNVHTTQFPGGAVRGDLTMTGTTLLFAADLRGSNEVPANSSSAVGSALITVDTATNTVSWEVVAAGLTTNTTGAHIHGPGGNAGTNVGVFIGFPNATNGRARGTTTVTAAADLTKLAQLIANPSEFYVNVHTSQFGGGEVRGQLAPAKEVDIPVAGAVGTFLTDVRIFNPSYDTTLNGLVEYFPQGTTANVNASSSMVFNIPPRGTGVANNITNSASLLNAGTGIGALRITSVNNLVATSKIYSTSGSGTFGQYLPGIPRASALRRGVLPQLTNNADFRTNAGFFNPNTSAVTVRLELRDENSNVVATSLQTFQALAFQQNSIGTYFPGVDLSSRANLTLAFDASAAIDVYAAVNDNRTTDSFVVVAQEDPGVASNQQ